MKKTSLFIKKEIARIQSKVGDDIAASRKAQNALGDLAARMLGSKVDYEPVKELGDADMAVPEEAFEGMVILYLHGGAYTAGDLAYARGFGGVLAESTRIATLCLGYRLAPEEPFPAALEDALEAYRHLLKSYDPSKIIFVGESAGGGLCYALCHAAHDEGLPMPRGVVAISPWTDLTMSFPAHTRNEAVDPTLSNAMLSMCAGMYAEGKLDHPYVSPVFGELGYMPDSLIFAGSSEVLEDDSVEMANRLAAAGVNCMLHIEPEAWHAYVLYGIFEARQALEMIDAFIWERMR